MAFWQQILIQIVATGFTVLIILGGFYRWVLKPYLACQMKHLEDIAEGIEPRVTRGVKVGVLETLRELPESTMRDSTKQFLRFGSDLMENGLSSFLGGSDELQRRARANRKTENDHGNPTSESSGDRS